MVLSEVSDADQVRIERFQPRYASDVSRLNREWIVGRFEVKDIDEAFFQDPAAEVIARGGEIFCALMGDAVVGCACATLWSNSGLTAALRVYDALGFAHRPPPVSAPHSDADVYMELDLG